MEIQELEDRAEVMLRHFFVSFRKASLMRGMSIQFIIDDFGLIVCCINRMDYKQVDDSLATNFGDWRKVFIATTDDVNEKKYEVLWALMRGGYMRWMRINYPRQVRNILNGPDNLGHRIIEERLRIWGDKPKNSFWIEDNKDVLRVGILSELSRDPGFFDHMPELE